MNKVCVRVCAGIVVATGLMGCSGPQVKVHRPVDSCELTDNLELFLLPIGISQEIELRKTRGEAVVLRCEGGKVQEVLSACNPKVNWTYTGLSPEHNHHDYADQLQAGATLPIPGVSLGASTDKVDGQNVDWFTAGIQDIPEEEAERVQQSVVAAGDKCSTATHVVTQLVIGAWYATMKGKSLTVAGAEVSNAGLQYNPGSDDTHTFEYGEHAECEKTSSGAAAPPAKCDKPIVMKTRPIRR